MFPDQPLFPEIAEQGFHYGVRGFVVAFEVVSDGKIVRDD